MPANVFGAEPSRQGGAKPPLSFIVRVARGRNPRDVTVRTNQKGISRWSARRRRSTSSIIEVDRHTLPASAASIAGEDGRCGAAPVSLAAVLVYVVRELLLKLRIVLHHLDHLVLLLRIQT